MGLREWVNRHQGIVIGIVAFAIVGTVTMLFVNGQTGTDSPLGTRSFYTVDDGQHWFVDTADKAPPFEHDGKTAYRVRLFSTDGGKTPFAGYLERYTPEALKRIEAARKGEAEPKGRSVLSVIEELTMSGTEIKKPGAGNEWVARGDPQTAPPVLDVKGPKGDPAEPVMP